METLTRFMCKVNTTKSFWNGKFRESCGMDAYDGYNVTPTYIRHMVPHNRDSVSALLSLTEASNHFYKRGYWQTASYLKSQIEAVIGVLPIVKETSPGIGWHTYQKSFSFDRWSRKLHRYEVHTYVASPVYKNDRISGWPALMKFFLRKARQVKSDDPIDEKHLIRSPRSGTSSMKRRWTTPY